MAQIKEVINSSADHIEAALSARASTSVRLAQTVALLLGGYFVGQAGSASTLWITTLLDAPKDQKAKLWHAGYNRSKIPMPAIAVTAASIYTWLSSRANDVMFPRLSLPLGQSISFRAAYLISAGLTIGVIPYTLLVMLPTNDDIASIGAQDGPSREVSKTSGKDVDELLQDWSYKNYARMGIAGLGTALGIWASINWPSWKHL